MTAHRLLTFPLTALAIHAVTGCTFVDRADPPRRDPDAALPQEAQRNDTDIPNCGPPSPPEPPADAAWIWVRGVSQSPWTDDEIPNPHGMDLVVNEQPVEAYDLQDLQFSSFFSAGETTLELHDRSTPPQLVARHTFTAADVTFSDIELYPEHARNLPKHLVTAQGTPGAYISELIELDWGPPSPGHWRLLLANQSDEPITARVIALDPDNLQPDPNGTLSVPITEHLAPGAHVTVEVSVPAAPVVPGIEVMGELTQGTPTVMAVAVPNEWGPTPFHPAWAAAFAGSIARMFVEAPGRAGGDVWFFICRDDRFDSTNSGCPSEARSGATAPNPLQRARTIAGRPPVMLPAQSRSTAVRATHLHQASWR